ncbi:hypothetical protein Cgig2_015426 [Carnegiea gigantea]|uniref:non-specific serine/threonine protein kinase n=1 Tax=Carnegiea gigantea TaxID=171969 RepID=A0A9Q1Q8P3_9CARY|nr:hypothetical protein Cgig2_015426 [Carnegiea gigantea]
MGEKAGKPNRDQSSEVPNLDLNQLKVFSPLGRGAKGVVFHVRIDGSSDDLALKVVLKSSIKRRKEKQSNGFEQNRVSFEQQVLREFDHPLLPRLKGVLETERIVGYAIDYCPGRDLNSLRKQQVEKMFSDDIIRFYGAELILALEYLHKKGIVYRDLKPENVLIQENGHLMLVDFDLSTKLVPRSPKTRPSYELEKKPSSTGKKTQLHKLYPFCNSGISPEDSVKSGRTENGSSSNSDTSDSDSVVGKSNSFVGTEEYVAPEIIKGNGHDFAVDLWSLGVVLYEMLYGTTPFRGSNRKETFYRILTKSPDLVGETTPLRDLIRRLLEKDPNQRISLEEIRSHDFFKGVDWEMIVRLPRPPFIPGWPDVEEGMEGIKANDVESFVHGIFSKEEIPKNYNIDNNNNNKTCEENDKNNNISKIHKESINKGMWVEGLDQPLISDNFLVF